MVWKLAYDDAAKTEGHEAKEIERLKLISYRNLKVTIHISIGLYQVALIDKMDFETGIIVGITDNAQQFAGDALRLLNV